MTSLITHTYLALAVGTLTVLAGPVANFILSIVVMVTMLIISGILLRKKDRFPGMDVVKVIVAVGALVLGVMVVMDPGNEAATDGLQQIAFERLLREWPAVALSGYGAQPLPASLSGEASRSLGEGWWRRRESNPHLR